MPRYTPETERIKAEKTTKDYIEAGFNQAKLAKKRGVHRRTINKQVHRKPVQDCLTRFLNSPELKQALVEVGIDGLKAERITHTAILLQQNGEVVKADQQGGIETKDHHARHKFWKDLMVAAGALKTETNGKRNGIDKLVINIISPNSPSPERNKHSRLGIPEE